MKKNDDPTIGLSVDDWQSNVFAGSNYVIVPLPNNAVGVYDKRMNQGMMKSSEPKNVEWFSSNILFDNKFTGTSVKEFKDYIGRLIAQGQLK